MDRVRRRIAAILAADVVGYSRLVGMDEEATLATLKAYREIIDGLVARHEGRIFGSAGDSVVAEFASPVEALRCAVDIQLAIDSRNTDLPEPSRMRFRIGINLGDVVLDGDNLLGDGVNIAARLEALAPAGGVCISEAVYVQVRDRLLLNFLDLGEQKVKNIARPVRVYRVPLASEESVKSPFRGLDRFEFEHAELFFGRAHAVSVCHERLEQLAANGKSFLLIYGMSGSGKSSLLRAGLLPAIVRPGAVAGIMLWRRCLFRPFEEADVIASLVAGLIREGALPELAQERTATELTQLLRHAPDRAVGLIRVALVNAAAAAGSGVQARLVVAVDQMEELFTTETEPAAREGFVRVLAMFAECGFIWVIGTIRADFFHRCGQIPGFSALKDGLSSFELLPPSGPEIAQIIREPARATGLRFEEDPDHGRLDDVLQVAAVADAGSLPLLQFVLDALCRAGQERRLLTFAAYRALGGLEGAIARRADEVVDALPLEVRDSLPVVVRALTTVRLGDEAITARPAMLSDVAGRPTQMALVNAMIAARLLVSGENAMGDAVVRVAHEALMSHWPRAREIVIANRSFLETRARVQADAHRWLLENRSPDLLLPPGRRLAESEEMLLSRRDEVEDQVVVYVETSLMAQQSRLERERQTERAHIEAEEAAKRERLEGEAERRRLAAEAAMLLARRTRYAAVVALVLAVMAGGGALVGFRGQHEARRQALLAEVNASQAQAAEQKAIEARNQALRNQSLSLSFLSQQTAAAGDTEAAVLLALEALPKDPAAPDRPYLREAEIALYRALLRHHQTAVFRHDGGVTYAAFNPAGDRIVTSSFDKTARIWDVANGSEIAVLKGHDGAVENASFSPDGGHVATAGRDGTGRIWDAASGKQIFVLPQLGNVHTTMFNPAGTRVLTGSDLAASTIWDVQTGKAIVTTEGFGTSSATFSPDGLSFAASSEQDRSIRIWSAEDGRAIGKLDNQFWPDQVVFSPDGTKILAGAWAAITWNNMSRLWDVPSQSEIAILRDHTSDTHGGTFSHDGRYIATVSLDGTARLWNGNSGKARHVLGSESIGLKLSSVEAQYRDQEMNCVFSPDDRLLAAISTQGAVRVWDVESGTELSGIRGHRGLVEHVAFSPDGNRLLTASHDGTARLWDVDGVLTTTLRHKSPPTFAAFSLDGMRVVTVDSVAHIWDAASGGEIKTLDPGGGPIRHAAFSPDGRLVATASWGGSIVIWSVESGRETLRLAGDSAAVVHVEFSPRGNLLASASIVGTARLWNTSTGAEAAVLTANGNLRRVLFSPDGELVMTALTDNTARIWRSDGTELRILAGHEKRITAAAFSPDGSLAATTSLDGTARIWSIKDGSVVAILRGHDQALTDVAFGPDGRSIVTSSRDRTARIWSIPDGSSRKILSGQGEVLDYAAFSSNGLFVVTASSQYRSATLWDADSGSEVVVLADQRDATGTGSAAMRPVFSPDGTRIAVASGSRAVHITRVFSTSADLIAFARSSVPRELTSCERRRFFLPVEGETVDCPN
ncbi:MAG: AAA family ATPase [Inquilinus sp.]|uniref:nSTAND1 domain-containing NTPase n=1 Tax=Inquilinus sp. TaxID=1932117 RepID=UPI003F3EB066